MESTLSTVKGRIAVQVSKDKLCAAVLFLGESGDDPPDDNEVLAALMELNIILTDDIRNRIQVFIKKTTGKDQEPAADDKVDGKDQQDSHEDPSITGFVVARGVAPCHGADESIEWGQQHQDYRKEWEDDSSTDFYNCQQIVTVDVGAVIGTISSLVPISPGKDIFGNAIPAEGNPQPLEMDETITKTQDDPPQLIANVAGKVIQEDNKIHMVDVVLIKGDIGFDTGNLDTPAHVHIKGAIPDRFEVRSGKCVTVESVIEAALVRADGDIVVKGGIVGRNEGGVTAKGDISAKFCSEANITATGNIQIQKQIMASQLYTSGKLLAAQSSVIGGHVYATQGAEICYLGNDTDTATSIVICCDLDRLMECAAIDARTKWLLEAAKKISRQVESILDSETPLSSTQRQRTNSLNRKAKEIEEGLAKEKAQQVQLIEKIVLDEEATVIITGRVYRNASITIGRRMTLFEKELAGPIRIESRQIENVTEIVAVNQLTGSLIVLKSYKLTNEEIYQHFKSLVLPPEAAEST